MTARLGAGGMGEVYRATDTNLGRDVAIKILPPDVAADPERLARFRREAQLLASLNHPNIAAIHGLEEADGKPFLVLELVDGEDLAQRLARGPISVDEALDIARQIADALEEAHEKGVIHRDLKPGNIKVTPDGKAKVLDFGLAKLLAPAEPDSVANLSLSPTLTYHGTVMGVILGTAAYMAPEQARGKPVDKRADIWAFGVVLFEMLTGRQLFAGEVVSDTLAAVLTRDPNWDALPPTLPLRVRELLRRCLQRDPRMRFRDIGDVRLELLAAASEPNQAVVAPSPKWLRARNRSLAVAAVLGLIAGASVPATTAFLTRTTARSATPNSSRFSVALPNSAPFFVGSYPNLRLAISRDGRRIVYCARGEMGRLYLRQLGDLEIKPIPGTEGAYQPFFSPDGEWVAFFTQSGLLKKVSLAGGSPTTIATDLVSSFYVVGTWTEDNRIVFDTWNAGLRVVGADGGPIRTLTAPTAEWHQDPQILPGTTTILYFTLTGTTQRIEALSLDGGAPRIIVENASHPRYLASGHLLFMRDGNLMVAPFDAERVRVTGPAASVPLDEMVDNPGAANPLPQLAVSQSGTLVYAPRRADSNAAASFTWVDRRGTVEDIASVPITRPAFFDLSPDGRRVAISSRAGSKVKIDIYDLVSHTLTGLLEHEQDFPSGPIWSPDGQQLFFVRYGTHEGAVFSQAVNSSAQAKQLVSLKGTYFATTSVSRDGRFLVFSTQGPNTNGDLWVLNLSEPAAKPRAITDAPGNEPGGALSPDGRWIAYAADETGSYEVYVRRFPGGESKTRISTHGGFGPRWSSDGRELFFQADSGEKMMAALIAYEPELRAAEPRLLFQGHYEYSVDSGPGYAVAPDGRFLMMKGELLGLASELVIVENWFGEVERLAPRNK